MKVEDHEKAYKEHLKNLNLFIEEGIEENQRNIGYNVSQGSVELIAICLHKINLLQTSGDQLDHRIFKNKALIEKKLPSDFPNKKEILELMREIELERNIVCYGKRKPKKRIEKMIGNFNKLRKIINNILKNGKE
jgi:hypothetical protein